MNDQTPKNLREALDPVIERVERRQWQNNSALSLGGAGASVAVLLVALQMLASKSTEWRTLSMAFAASAIPIWLCLWQLSDTTDFWGDDGLKVIARPFWLNVGLCLFCSGLGLLGASLVVLIVEVSPIAASVVLVLCAVVTVLMISHAHAVKKNAPRIGMPATSAKQLSNSTRAAGGSKRRKR